MRQFPAVSGQLIVWKDLYGIHPDPTRHDIFLYDVTAGETYNLSNGEGAIIPNQPAISNDLVVWTATVGTAESNIYGCRFNPSEPVYCDVKKLDLTGSNQMAPQVFGNLVVWQDYVSGGESDIFYCEFDGETFGSIQEVTIEPGQQIMPRISGTAIIGDLIAWEDQDIGEKDVIAYDIERDIRSRITSAEGLQTSPDISGDGIVWQDNRNGNWDIFYKRYSPGPDIDIDPKVQIHRLRMPE
ncbi:hypothetical protein ACFL38_04660 [Candidatus Omnitrophota bacterium]